MTADQGKIVPYGIAGLVLLLVTGLVAIDVVASLPGAQGEAVRAELRRLRPSRQRARSRSARGARARVTSWRRSSWERAAGRCALIS